MLNETPLGVMLEEVAGQLLEKVMTFVPDRRLSGAEIVKLVKGVCQSGWILAVHGDPKGGDLRTTVVVRGAANKANKELFAISSQFVGWLMGPSPKFKTERKEGRTVVVLPYASAKPSPGTGKASWVWWPEKNDLVIGDAYPACADATTAALDGKTPSAVDHPVAQELRKTEGTFEPVCVAFIDPSACPEESASLLSVIRSLHKDQGVNQIDFRWGFDSEALMTVTRLVAPKPRKSGLSLFDQPTFDKTSLMPMPDSVDSFLELSINPGQFLQALEQLPATAPFMGQIEQLTETIKNAGQIDLRKDILNHLGPRFVAYLGAGRSAASTDDSLDAALRTGLSTTAAVAVVQSMFPKLTLVAEIRDESAFGKGLDSVIIVINNELEAQAMEKEAEERKAAGKTQSGAGGRTKQRRVPAPRFNPIPGQTKSFVLMTPTDSKLRFGPSSFRPTVMVQGKYVAFAVSTDAARAAIAAAVRKDWKPRSDLDRALENLPSKLIMLSVSDVSERLSSLLASLPGTLQTMINSSIALAKIRASGELATGTPAVPGGSGPGNQSGNTPAATGSMSLRGMGPRGPRTGQTGSGGPGMGSSAMGSSAMSNPGSAAAKASGGAADSMIVIKVDADKLPKAADLRTNLFPATFAIDVNDQHIRFVSRSAFPDFSGLIGMVPALGMMPPVPGLDYMPGMPAGTGTPGTTAQAAAAPPAPTAAPGAPAAGKPGGGRPGRPARGPD
jgi:hypothetical protein